MIDPKQVVADYFFKNEQEGKLFRRGDFTCPYKGSNRFGVHDDIIHCCVYEDGSKETNVSSAFNQPLLKNLLSPHIVAEKFPTSVIDPDILEDLYLFGDDQISHTVFVWNETVSDLRFDLIPVYSVEKSVLLFDRGTDIISFHELYLKVTPVN